MKDTLCRIIPNSGDHACLCAASEQELGECKWASHLKVLHRKDRSDKTWTTSLLPQFPAIIGLEVFDPVRMSVRVLLSKSNVYGLVLACPGVDDTILTHE